MAVWDPSQYLKFEDHRTRPPIDLLARIDLAVHGDILDLGCGAGNVTRLLARRFPDRAIVGVDSSPGMLEKARAVLPSARFIEADIARFTPDAPPALLFSNAALHWLSDHATLFPALLARVAPGGVLAVQMPKNHGAPSHTLVLEAAQAASVRETIEPVFRSSPVESAEFYYDLLAPRAAAVDLWEIEYLHVLEGPNPVVEWTKGTALRPVLDALTPAETAEFMAEYGRRIALAYPKSPDGKTLFRFRRLFLVATAR
jgi:trans-aconitate 2-methyltransferase